MAAQPGVAVLSRVVDTELSVTITGICRQSRGTYGSPRIYAVLRLDMGIRVSRKPVARLMRAEGIEGVSRRRMHGCTRRDPGQYRLMIWSIARSPSMDRTGCGSPTSPNSAAGRQGVRCGDRRCVVPAADQLVDRRSSPHRTRRRCLGHGNLVAATRTGIGLVHHADHGTQYTS